MADLDLQTVLNSGDIASTFLGGTAAGNRVLTSDEVDAKDAVVNALVTTNTNNIATNTADIATNTANIATNVSDISAIDTRVSAVEASHTLLINASSTASSQQPTGTDAALQVEFGALQTSTDIDVAANGAITFKTAGKYIISTFFQYGRTGASGTSILFNRLLVNGTQQGNSLGAKVDNAEVLVPWSSSIQFTASTNDVVTIEIIRDSSGSDSGGIFASTPTAAGWNLAPCAAIQIYKAI